MVCADTLLQRDTYRLLKVARVAVGVVATARVDRIDDLRSSTVGHLVPIGGTILTGVSQTTKILAIFDESVHAALNLDRHGTGLIQPVSAERVAIHGGIATTIAAPSHRPSHSAEQAHDSQHHCQITRDRTLFASSATALPRGTVLPPY